MKSIITVLGCCLIGTLSFAQQNVLSSGSESTSAAGTISYSVGLIHYKDAEGIGGSSSAGSQIPFEIIQTLSISDVNLKSLDLYPNPTSSVVILKLKEAEQLDYKIHDISGKQIFSGQISERETKIALNDLKTSIYILSIYRQNAVIGTYKIIKK